MSKVMIALGSFIVGASCMFLMLSGSHTSTFAQAPPTSRPVVNEGMEPTVPALRSNVVIGLHWDGGTQALDGLECKNCALKNMTLEYSGGAYRLENCTFSGTTRVVLKGAAANTLAILPLLQAITSGNPPEAPKPKIPLQRTATAKQQTEITFLSPYGQP